MNTYLMNTILSFAVAGLNAAQKKFSTHAENVVNANTPGYKATRPIQVDTGHGPAIILDISGQSVSPQTTHTTASNAQTPNESLTSPYDLAGNDVDLAEEFIEILRAKTSYKASAKIIETNKELNDELFNILT